VILFRRAVADFRRSLIGWSVGVCVAVVLIVGLYPSVQGQEGIEKMFDELPAAIKALAGAQGGLSIISPVGYLHSRLFVLILPLLLTIFGIGAGARLTGGSEDDKTLEFLLSHPVSRRRVVLERFAAVTAMVAGLGGVALISTLVMVAAIGVIPAVSVLHVVGACAATVCIALLFSSIAFATGCVAGRRAPAISIATIVAVGGYIVHSLFALVPSLAWTRPLSPWNWYLSDVILLSGPTLVSIAVPIAVAAAVVCGGLWRFERRDLR
jgi:ABC-2 type transport system permease protein